MIDEKFLIYYTAKRIIKNAEWDENLERYYVELKDGYISLNEDEYEYFEKLVNNYNK